MLFDGLLAGRLDPRGHDRDDVEQPKRQVQERDGRGRRDCDRLQAGKEIEVLTGDSKKHSFGLDEKDSRVEMDPRITVGTKVRLVQDKDSSGRRMIRVVAIVSAFAR
jgi:hypothetical protein